MGHGLVVLWDVRSSPTRDRTCVPCTGEWILNHWTTREAPEQGIPDTCALLLIENSASMEVL